jgi:long-chain fatty acid transport protein
MTRTIKLAVAAAVALTSTTAFATNGDHLIGLGAKALGMGGVGIAATHGAESALANPAMITSVKNTEISFGGTIFMPKVETDTSSGLGSNESASDLSVIPEVSLASKINDNVFVGIGMWGTAGMGVDHRDAPGNFNMVTNLQLMQFGVPVAYKQGGLSVGITPILQYGSLDINYATPAGVTGAGVAQDLAFGYTAGAAYEMSGITLGAVYKSAIEMDYTNVLSTAMAGFGVSGFSDKLEQPAEMGIGLSYKMREHTIALDYKQIKWSDAKGYKEFKWDDQDVYAIGYEYATSGWAARVGYNYAKSPISDQGLADGGLTNALNLLGFPATVESHYTVGGTYNLSKQTSVDLAYVYAPEVEDSYNHALFTQNPLSPVIVPITTKHSQQAVSVQLSYAF